VQKTSSPPRCRYAVHRRLRRRAADARAVLRLDR